MRGEHMMDALGLLDEELLVEAETLDGRAAGRGSARRKIRWGLAAALAAAAVLLCGAAYAAITRWHMPAEGATYTGDMIETHDVQEYPVPDGETLPEGEALSDQWFIAQAVEVLAAVNKEEPDAAALTVTRQTNQMWSREEAVVTFADGEGRTTEAKFDAQSGYLIGVTAFDKEIPEGGSPMGEAEALAVAQGYYDALPYAEGYTYDYVEKYDDHAWSFSFDRPFSLTLWGEEVTVCSDYEQVRIVIDPCTGAFQLSNCFYVPLLDDHAPEDVPLTREEAVAAVERSGILSGDPAAYAVSGEIAVCLPRPEAVGWWLGETAVEDTSPAADTAVAQPSEPGGERYYGLTRLGWALTFRQQPEGALFETIYYVAVDLYTGEILAIDMAG